MTAEGKGALSDASDLSLGAALWPGSPVRQYLDRADVVLAVGTRMAMVPIQPTQQVIQIDVDPDEIGRNHSPTHGLLGDARATLERLADRLRAAGPAVPS
jgi:acetolactate synthase-1/2/3 large subunit